MPWASSEASNRLIGSRPALGVGEVRGEQEQLVALLLDQPAHVVERERRELHLAADVVRRRHRELGDHRLELGEALGGGVEVTQEPRSPTTAPSSMTPQRRRRGTARTRRRGRRQVRNFSGLWWSEGKSLARRFSPAADVVLRDRPAVVVPRRAQPPATEADVAQHRDPRLREARPHRLVRDVRRRPVPVCRGRDRDGCTPSVEGPVKSCPGPAPGHATTRTRRRADDRRPRTCPPCPG